MHLLCQVAMYLSLSRRMMQHQEGPYKDLTPRREVPRLYFFERVFLTLLYAFAAGSHGYRDVSPSTKVLSGAGFSTGLWAGWGC
eukprot:1052963-Amphidinium_carterae.1